MEAADTNPTQSGISFADDPFALEYHIYNTTGVRVVVKFDYQTRNLIANNTNIVSMKWYVKDFEPVFMP